MSANTVYPEVKSARTGLKQIWMAGDYDRFSRYMEGGARDFFERLNIEPGSTVVYAEYLEVIGTRA